MGHTPTPWAIDLDGNNEPLRARDNIVVSGSDGDVVCEVMDGEERNDGQAMPNARLIAAAPDLLAACREALDYIGTQSKGATQDMLRAAIAKATA